MLLVSFHVIVFFTDKSVFYFNSKIYAGKKTMLTSLKPFNGLKTITRNFHQSIRRMALEADDVLIEEINDKGILVLNRPKALNSLNLSMVNKIYPTLVKWEKEKSLVIVKGAGNKAFCAGGDVKAIAEAAFKGEKLGHTFFRHEYTNNGLIGSYKIPYVALIDGIVMGGGVGLSVHGPYRVATERSVFAMPETQIGLFPDVGGSFFLPKLKGKLGCYLALTGYRLKGSDLLHAGIATHFCDSFEFPKLEKDLLQCSSIADIEKTLAKYHKADTKEFSLAPYLDKIDNIFLARSVEEICDRLRNDASQWAQDTLNTLSKMSPTSLKITLRQLELGKNMSLHDCLKMEYRLAVKCVESHDFCEGVRALLIDKDQNPKWNPAKLEHVTNELVDQYFANLPKELELNLKHKL